MSANRPRKRLPVNPSIEHLRKQAKRLAKAESLPLSDAQYRMAGDYGCRHWAELLHVVETMSRGAGQTTNVKYEMQALPAAANRNDLAGVRQLLEAGGYTQHDLDLALARAVLRFNERREIAELLVEHGADPDGQYGSNYGPIVLVTVEALDPDGLQFLLGHGADVTFAPIETKYGLASPMIGLLSTYVRGRNAEKHRMIDLLLSHGAQVPPEVTPLFMAIHRGDVNALRQLIEADPSLVARRFPEMPHGNVSLRGATLLHMAIEFGEVECAEQLMQSGAQINAQAAGDEAGGDQTPIFHAIASPVPGQNESCLEYLVNECRQWIDMKFRATLVRFGKRLDRPMTPLEYAESLISDPQHGELRLLRRLGGPRIDNAHFVHAVQLIDEGKLPELEVLLKQHPELATLSAEESGSFSGPYFAHPRLLWFVAENPVRTGRLPANICEIAQAIISAGASRQDITYTAELVATGRVPHEMGVQRSLLELLVARGADPIPALSAAVMERSMDAAQTLQRLGAKPDLAAAAGLGRLTELRELLGRRPSEDQLGRALLAAAIHGQDEALSALVRDGSVDVNRCIGLGTTALHTAAFEGHQSCVEQLLELGADSTLRDGRFNGTAADWARHGGHDRLADLLQNAALARK